MKRILRSVGVIMGCAAVNFVILIAVSSGSQGWAQAEFGIEDADPPRWIIAMARRQGAAYVLLQTLGTTPDPRLFAYVAPPWRESEENRRLVAQLPAPGEVEAGFGLRCDYAGWPFLAFRADTHGMLDHGTRVFYQPICEGGVTLTPRVNGPDWRDRVIPLTPIWSGFLANTALFLIALVGPLLIGKRLRRLLRRRQGRCLACGHLRGPEQRVCPECGVRQSASPVAGEIDCSH